MEEKEENYTNTSQDEEQICLKNENIKPRRIMIKKINLEKLYLGDSVGDVRIGRKYKISNTNGEDSLNTNLDVLKQNLPNDNNNVGSTRKNNETPIKTCKRKQNSLNKIAVTGEKQAEKLDSNTSKGFEKSESRENYFGSFVMSRMDFDKQLEAVGAIESAISPIRLVPPAPEGDGQYSESPECKRKRIEIVSKQCRLHPSNSKFLSLDLNM